MPRDIKKDLGINVRKCDYCVQNDTHSGPDHLSLDATLSGISLAPASSVSPRPLKEKKSSQQGLGHELARRVLLGAAAVGVHVCASGADYRKLLILRI